MISVVERGDERIFKVECPNCISKLEFVLSDVVYDDNLKTIVCPVCSKKITLKRV